MQKKDYMIQLLKYFIMAVIVGIIVGAIDALFGRVLIAISDFRTIHYQYLLPFLPIVGLVITAIYYVSVSNDWNMVNTSIRRKCW